MRQTDRLLSVPRRMEHGIFAHEHEALHRRAKRATSRAVFLKQASFYEFECGVCVCVDECVCV